MQRFVFPMEYLLSICSGLFVSRSVHFLVSFDEYLLFITFHSPSRKGVADIPDIYRIYSDLIQSSVPVYENKMVSWLFDRPVVCRCPKSRGNAVCSTAERQRCLCASIIVVVIFRCSFSISYLLQLIVPKGYPTGQQAYIFNDLNIFLLLSYS